MLSRQIRHQEIPKFEPTYSPQFERVTTRESTRNGSLVKESVFEQFNPADADKGISYLDYSLENIIALDNPSLLNPIQMVETKINGISNLKNFNENVEASQKKAEEK